MLHNLYNRGHLKKKNLKERLTQVLFVCTLHVRLSVSNQDLWADAHIRGPINKCQCAHAWFKMRHTWLVKSTKQRQEKLHRIFWLILFYRGARNSHFRWDHGFGSWIGSSFRSAAEKGDQSNCAFHLLCWNSFNSLTFAHMVWNESRIQDVQYLIDIQCSLIIQ